MKTVLYLLRHGESVANAERRFAGSMDFPLTETGIRQAQAAAERLRDVPFDAIYASDLLRAHQTAEPHAVLHGLPIRDEVGLRELFCGIWEGEKISDLEVRYPHEFLYEWRHRIGTFTPPGGESFPHLAARMRDTLTRIAEENPGKTVLIASHAAAISAFYFRYVYGYSDEEVSEKLFYPANTAHSVVEYENGVFTPISYSVGGTATF